ncbi:hypothetical protein GFC01_05800 [Desulfofundulus thermobenzoicus]|uniref:Uncharacterized protein n=1 Tax=Desulfofundulus thermobenzoicus TaxID=29376 RepID=A0A6N7IQB2_9FIRM|nr:hypothetical protein [Desulfofundulus thermobenzoicus]MQL51783.1 hypothetical protein [Desulfofundulus thermobenzoicus]
MFTEDMIENVATDVLSAKKIAKKLKEAAEKYVHDPHTMPHLRHWALFPGRTRVCFTKTVSEDGARYCMSVSAPYGRVSDLMILALLKLFDAPKTGVEEIPPSINPNVRLITWLGEIFH